MSKNAKVTGSVGAGFPSPAEQYQETPLDLNELLVKRPAATFFVKVQGESMMNTLLDQELGIMNIWQVKQNGVERFDIVVIHSKELEEDIIKRIIGLPGEDVEYKNDKLYING